MTKTMKLFVYGTLRKHEKNHFLLKGCRCVIEQAWVYGELFNTGLGYPSMKASLQQKVYGEVYEISEEQFEPLDELEDYIPARKGNLYERVKQMVHSDMGSFEAYVYVSNRKELSADPILHGDWKLYRLLQERPTKVFYFAYGSCMDGERFRKANVDYFFSNVIGSAVLPNYSMKYLFQGEDGGRADIIEDGGRTEGILYEVPFEGVEYLLKREGFIEGWYRPVFVDVEVKGKLLTNVLSFHVYNKIAELAPPMHYATEILRGARGRVSEEYFKQLEQQLSTLGLKIF